MSLETTLILRTRKSTLDIDIEEGESFGNPRRETV